MVFGSSGFRDLFARFRENVGKICCFRELWVAGPPLPYRDSPSIVHQSKTASEGMMCDLEDAEPSHDLR